MKDLTGRTLAPGDRIAYAISRGRSPAIEFYTVLKIETDRIQAKPDRRFSFYSDAPVWLRMSDSRALVVPEGTHYAR